jgi:hypothetical protein
MHPPRESSRANRDTRADEADPWSADFALTPLQSVRPRWAELQNTDGEEGEHDGR